MPFHRARCSFSPVLAVSLSFLCLSIPWPATTALGWELCPQSGGEGTEIHLRSEVAQPLASVPSVVIFGDEDGVVVDDVRVVKDGLRGRVGPVAGSFVGQVEIVWGRRVELPRQTYRGLTGTFVSRRATWHVGDRSTLAGPFAVDAGGAVQGRLADPNTIDIEVPPLPPETIFPSIRVDIVIDGGSNNNQGGSTGSGGDGSGDGNTGANDRPFHAGHLVLDRLPSMAGFDGPTTGNPTHDLAIDLAAILDAHLADLGLSVESEGSRLRIHTPDGTIYRGFAVLSVSTF